MDELTPLTRSTPPLSILCAVAEAETEGLDVVSLVCETLRRHREAWKLAREAEAAERIRRHGPTWAARLLLEARANGETLTARQAGAAWNVKPGTVREALLRLRRHALKKTVTERTRDGSAAPS